MASLQNKQIDQSYPGLIKTNDEAALGATEKVIQDGAGNNSTLSMGTASASFTGTLDLSGATVTGLPAGAAGLESGTGTDSMQSAASLTTTGASAGGTKSIALGNGAVAGTSATENYNIAIGNSTQAADGAVIIGNSINGSAALSSVAIGNTASVVTRGVAVGRLANATGANAISIGNQSTATSTDAIALGDSASATGTGSDGRIAIGKNSAATKNKAVVVGVNGCSSASEGIAIGDDVDIASNSDRTIAIGNAISVGSGAADSIVMGTSADSTAAKGIALGFDAHVTATEGIALGYQVTADKAQTVSMKALDLQTPSTPTAGGIIMTDAGSTERRLNIDASGNLQIDSTPVGGGGGSQVFALQGGNGMSGVPAYNENTTDQYKSNVMTTGYGFQSANASTNFAYYTFVALQEGETISEFAVNVSIAAAASTIECAVYDTAIDANGLIYLNNRLATFGTIDSSTTGDKVVTLGTPFTMPAGKLNGQVAFVFFRSDNSSQLSGWAQGIWNGGGMYLAGGTAYRAMMPQVIPGVSPGTALPATIGDRTTVGVTYGSQTQAPLVFLYK